MPELLRRWMATVGKLALSAGLLWMGVDLAHAQPAPVAVAEAPTTLQNPSGPAGTVPRQQH